MKLLWCWLVLLLVVLVVLQDSTADAKKPSKGAKTGNQATKAKARGSRRSRGSNSAGGRRRGGNSGKSKGRGSPGGCNLKKLKMKIDELVARKMLCVYALEACKITQSSTNKLTELLYQTKCPEGDCTGDTLILTGGYTVQFCPKPSKDFDRVDYLVNNRVDKDFSKLVAGPCSNECFKTSRNKMKAITRTKGSNKSLHWWKNRSCKIVSNTKLTKKWKAVVCDADKETCDDKEYTFTIKNHTATVNLCKPKQPPKMKPDWDAAACTADTDCQRSKTSKSQRSGKSKKQPTCEKVGTLLAEGATGTGTDVKVCPLKMWKVLRTGSNNRQRSKRRGKKGRSAKKGKGKRTKTGKKATAAKRQKGKKAGKRKAGGAAKARKGAAASGKQKKNNKKGKISSTQKKKGTKKGGRRANRRQAKTQNGKAKSKSNKAGKRRTGRGKQRGNKGKKKGKKGKSKGMTTPNP